MATYPKKPQGKKPGSKKIAAAQVNGPAVRKSPATDAAEPVSPAKSAAPVLVNAVKPEEKLPDTALVESAVDSFEKSMKAAVPAAVAVNRKLVDIAQANMNSGLELARDLANAKTPMEMMRLGMNYWHENMGVFEAQAQELRMLSAKFMATTAEPIRAHMRRA
jgi:hypothetical protein